MYKRGQIAIFIILAILIVVVVGIFFVFRTGLLGTGIPLELAPVYEYYSECIKLETLNGLSLLGSQGGRISSGEFSSGSEFSPSSSELKFLGLNIPYWFYQSGNGVVKENVPSERDVEEELEIFLTSRLGNCDFSRFYESGFFIDFENPRVRVDIQDSKTDVIVVNNLVVRKENQSARKSSHEISVDSKIGKFHKIASRIYDKQVNEAFLEDYAIDVLRLYTPVDGVEAECSPLIWRTEEVVNEFKSGLENNLRSIKFNGDYYALNDKKDEYFVVDLEVDESVQVFYLKDWPSKVEVTPTEGDLMIAKPIGNQEGLGALGFCYIPYHFVYDVNFPIIIQIYDGLELFQFPINVIIDNNLPRKADLLSIENNEAEFDACDFQEGEVQIYTFDSNLNPIEAELRYQCLDSVCELGNTELSGETAVLNSEITQCVNGYLVARAEGYVEKKQIFSSNSETRADIILDREYEVEVELMIDGKISNDEAIVSFSSQDKVATAILPENNRIKLSENLYELSAYVYGTANIVIPASTKSQCIEVAKGGIFGIFGATKEKCFDIEIPETRIDKVLTAGGKSEDYLLESNLKNSKIIINVKSLGKPINLEQLQVNYEIFNANGAEVEF